MVNITDYKKFKKLMLQQYQQMKKFAKMNNLRYAKSKRPKSDTKALNSKKIYKNDLMMLKQPYTNEKKNNMQYDWYVKEVLGNYKKHKHRMKNIFTKEEMMVN